jgi:hypothetical protein
MVTAITRGLAATTWLPNGTSLATTTTMTVAATTTIDATVAAMTTIGATVVYPIATTTGTATKPGMVGLSATTIDNRIAGGLLAVATLRQDLLTAHGCDMASPGAVMRGDALRKAGLPE